ncbi:MAG: hypothetical protein INR69_09650 [Mucilaginibacter polytrichastri]|nr:hypothetical protein [Mucilaginibacter polytrichastri]
MACLLLYAGGALAQQDDDHPRETRREKKVYRKQLGESIATVSSRIETLANHIATRFTEDFGPFDGDWPSAPQEATAVFAGENGMDVSEQSASQDDDARKTKRYVKVYTVNAGDKLQIDNQFGRVAVNTWNKNEIKVDIEIKAYASSDDQADDLLGSVGVSDSKSGSLISFRTSINRDRSRWGSNNGRRRGVQVNYTVFMPPKNALAVSNKYGSTEIPDFEGPVTLQSGYGSLKAGRLSNGNCTISTSYGSCDIESMGGGNVRNAYGSFSLGSGNNLTADLSYGSAKIGSLRGAVKLDISYVGGFRINSLENSLKNLAIDAAYSGITIGTGESANFDFDVTVKYSGFSYDKGRVANLVVNPDEQAKGFNPTKNYKGRIGQGNGSVNINSRYTSVRFE